jgi:hypothetical protein
MSKRVFEVADRETERPYYLTFLAPLIYITLTGAMKTTIDIDIV